MIKYSFPWSVQQNFKRILLFDLLVKDNYFEYDYRLTFRDHSTNPNQVLLYTKRKIDMEILKHVADQFNLMVVGYLGTGNPEMKLKYILQLKS